VGQRWLHNWCQVGEGVQGAGSVSHIWQKKTQVTLLSPPPPPSVILGRGSPPLPLCGAYPFVGYCGFFRNKLLSQRRKWFIL
jgi:hypothetical protein